MIEKMYIKEKIIEALESIFIYVDPNEADSMILDEYIDDSIQFMSFIVALEDKFSIEFPPELLLIERLNNINDITIIVEELTSF